MAEDCSIAYQNKDIASKYLGESLKNKTFAVYGIDVPKIENKGVVEDDESRTVD